jgi:Mg2+/Co2+ transporter CorB
MTLFVTGVLIALVISALCSVMEATLLSLTPAQVATLSRSRPRIGRIWQGFKSNVERPIAVILLLNVKEMLFLAADGALHARAAPGT